MENIILYILSTAYSGIYPAMNTAAALCSINGQNVPCNFGGAEEFVSTLMAVFTGIWILMFAILILVVIASWKVYVKAGRPGWASLVPVYNIVVMLEIIGKPTWWVILYFIPIVNIVIGFIVVHELAKAFGKDIGFTIGLILLPVIFFPILAFGKSVYVAGNVPTSVPPVVPMPPQAVV